MPRSADLVITLTLYSRPGCHLCDDMKAVVQRVVRSTREPISIEEVDISADPDLEARYGEQIPVLLVNGRKAFKYKVSEKDLRRKLQSIVGNRQS